MRYTVNSSGYDYTKKIKGCCQDKADNLKNKILNSVNTEEIYDIKGKKYYIAKDMRIEDIPAELKEGDAVLFERGGLWRISYGNGIVLPNGVTIGAYGTGDKPKFYGSTKNYADNNIWEKVECNLYKTFLPGGNPGIIVFDDEACLGVKKWTLDDVKSNYDFFYEYETEYIYFYYEGNIGEDFNSIEIGQRGNLITINSNCVADNLCVKYTGSHGIVVNTSCENVSITNNEIGCLGGSMQFGTTRFGNGIEIQLGSVNSLVKNNYVYECYDAGITFQTWTSANLETSYHNVNFIENLIENCSYGIEFFTTNKDDNGLYSDYKDITFESNIIRFSGYEWSQLQRPDPWMNSHIRGGNWAYVPDCENFNIVNNIFDISRASMIFWWWHDEKKGYLHPVKHPGLTVKHNCFYQAKTADGRVMNFYENVPVYAETKEDYIKAVKSFDSNPNEVVWF
ncbi:MAG: right-handed parallel beta-helix repeat-containing protein [Clostridia bacterium]|nr:right-handed parallel beta-helix repeat-containing protein [Clostridia bacterium]